MLTPKKRGKVWYYRFTTKENGKRKFHEKGSYATKELAIIAYQERFEPDKVEKRSKNDVYTYCTNFFVEQHQLGVTQAKTANDYIRTLENHIRRDVFGTYPITVIEPETIKEFYLRLANGEVLLRSGDLEDIKPVSAKTIHRIHRILRAPFNNAVRYNHVKNGNPFLTTKLPPISKTYYDTLTMKDIGTFFEELKKLNEPIVRAYIMLSALMGIRRGECASLEWSDVDFINKKILIRKSMSKQPTRFAKIATPANKNNVYVIKSTKTDRERHIPMTDEIEAVFLELKKYHEKMKIIHPHWKTMIEMYSVNDGKQMESPQVRDLIFRWPDGDYMRPDYMTKRHKEFMEELFPKRPIRLHDERHSFATNMLKAKIPMHEIQALIGHAKISTTIDQYGHINADDCRSSLEKFNHKVTKKAKKKKKKRKKSK